MKRYADPGAAIQAAAGDRFAIELAGNPTTGYTWQVHVDSRHLELLGREYQPGGIAAGAGGVEVFLFRAIAPGETEIDCDYRRPWEKEVHTDRRFRVVISG